MHLPLVSMADTGTCPRRHPRPPGSGLCAGGVCVKGESVLPNPRLTGPEASSWMGKLFSFLTRGLSNGDSGIIKLSRGTAARFVR